MDDTFTEIHISLPSLLQQFSKVPSTEALTISKIYYYGFVKSKGVAVVTNVIFLSDKHENQAALYESLLPAGLSLLGVTPLKDKHERSFLNISIELLTIENIETIKKQNPAIVDSVEYPMFIEKSTFKFSECVVIHGSDDWNTKVEMCFESLFKKLSDLHFTETHAFVTPKDGICALYSSPFVSIPFNLEIEHFGDTTAENKTITVQRAVLQLKEYIKREGPDGSFTNLFQYSSVEIDGNQPYLSLKSSEGKTCFSTEIEAIANTKASEPEPLPPLDLDFGKLLINPHLEVKHKPKDLCQLIKGDYAYYHYHCDGFDDEGWGCAYRSLQTIWSWLAYKGRVNRMPPSHKEIQECLVKIGDKPSKFIGSRGWIGSFEIGYVLQNLANVEYRSLHSSSGKDLDEHGRALAYHFEHDGAPVMIGGGSYAHTILGVDYNRKTGECEYLILDPHYTGKDIAASAISGNGIVWKTKKFFDPKSYYNLLLVINP